MNNKKKIYYAEAERLYVIEQMTIKEIAARLNLAVRTIKYWKQGQDWDVKKKEHLESRQVTHENSYLYARKLFDNIKEDCDKGEKISNRRLHAIADLVDIARRFKKREIKIRKVLGNN